MIISKKRFQKLVDEEVRKALQKQEKEEELRQRFWHIGDRLDAIETRLFTGHSVNDGIKPTHD